MKLIFLSEQFYEDYKAYTEIEQKSTRPYAQVYTKINGVQFAIPLRSNIPHKEHVLWTDKENGCGLDFTKAVVVTDDSYIDKARVPYIRKNEFNALRGKEYIIKKKLLKHIADYKKAETRQHIARERQLRQYSTMQYFEEYIEDLCNE